MSKYLDLDDVVNGNPKAKEELGTLRARVKELKDNISLLINFIPEGWEMPLGWNQVVGQVKNTLEVKDESIQM